VFGRFDYRKLETRSRITYIHIYPSIYLSIYIELSIYLHIHICVCMCAQGTLTLKELSQGGYYSPLRGRSSGKSPASSDPPLHATTARCHMMSPQLQHRITNKYYHFSYIHQPINYNKSIKNPHRATRGLRRSHVPAPPQGATNSASRSDVQAWGAVKESQQHSYIPLVFSAPLWFSGLTRSDSL